MPSYSIGFAVASTWKGSGSTNVSPSTVICCSCIASSSADWVFGGVRLISSASSSPGEERPSAELELPEALVVDERPGQVGRQQVRGELRPREVEAEGLGEGPRRQRLAEPGEVLEQHVALGQDAGQHEPQGVALADDGLLDLGQHATGELTGLHATCDDDIGSELLDAADDDGRSRRRTADGGSVEDGEQVGADPLPGLGVVPVQTVAPRQPLVDQPPQPVAQRRVGGAGGQVPLDDPQVRRQAVVVARLGQRRVDAARCQPGPRSPRTSMTTQATATHTVISRATRSSRGS